MKILKAATHEFASRKKIASHPQPEAPTAVAVKGRDEVQLRRPSLREVEDILDRHKAFIEWRSGKRAVFVDLDLSNFDFRGRDLTSVYFRGCNLMGANFTKAKMRAVLIDGGDFRGSRGVLAKFLDQGLRFGPTTKMPPRIEIIVKRRFRNAVRRLRSLDRD